MRHPGASRTALWLDSSNLGFCTIALTFAPGFEAHPGVERGAEVFDMILVSVAALLLVVQVALLIDPTMDPAFNVVRPVAIATGVLLLAVGNYLGKARQNGFIGLKTPWTLADAGVWDKTHRFTGRAMFLGRLILIVLGFDDNEFQSLANRGSCPRGGPHVDRRRPLAQPLSEPCARTA